MDFQVPKLKGDGNPRKKKKDVRRNKKENVLTYFLGKR